MHMSMFYLFDLMLKLSVLPFAKHFSSSVMAVESHRQSSYLASSSPPPSNSDDTRARNKCDM